MTGLKVASLKVTFSPKSRNFAKTAVVLSKLLLSPLLIPLRSA